MYCNVFPFTQEQEVVGCSIFPKYPNSAVHIFSWIRYLNVGPAHIYCKRFFFPPRQIVKRRNHPRRHHCIHQIQSGSGVFIKCLIQVLDFGIRGHGHKPPVIGRQCFIRIYSSYSQQKGTKLQLNSRQGQTKICSPPPPLFGLKCDRNIVCTNPYVCLHS